MPPLNQRRLIVLVLLQLLIRCTFLDENQCSKLTLGKIFLVKKLFVELLDNVPSCLDVFRRFRVLALLLAICLVEFLESNVETLLLGFLEIAAKSLAACALGMEGRSSSSSAASWAQRFAGDDLSFTDEVGEESKDDMRLKGKEWEYCAIHGRELLGNAR